MSLRYWGESNTFFLNFAEQVGDVLVTRLDLQRSLEHVHLVEG